MKKIVTMLLSLLAMGLMRMELKAQVAIDTTRQNTEEAQPSRALPQSTTVPPHYQDDVVQDRSQYNMVASKDVPPLLRKTLQSSSEFKGWENSTIYLDKSTGYYSVEIPGKEKTKSYRFDKRGNRVKDD